jgi:hypothetical protein
MVTAQLNAQFVTPAESIKQTSATQGRAEVDALPEELADRKSMSNTKPIMTMLYIMPVAHRLWTPRSDKNRKAIQDRPQTIALVNKAAMAQGEWCCLFTFGTIGK